MVTLRLLFATHYTNNDAKRVVFCTCTLLPNLLPSCCGAVVRGSDGVRQQREEKLVDSFVKYCQILLGVENFEKKNLTCNSWNCLLPQSCPVLLTCMFHQAEGFRDGISQPCSCCSLRVLAFVVLFLSLSDFYVKGFLWCFFVFVLPC